MSSNSQNKVQKQRTKRKRKTRFCKFYNPYFKTGCQFRNNCKYSHMTQYEYVDYCNQRNQKKKPFIRACTQFEESMKYIDNQKYQSAYLILRKLVLNHEFNGKFNFWLGRCHNLMRNDSNARYYYRKAIAINPANSSHHSYYAQFCCEIAKKNTSCATKRNQNECRFHFEQSLAIQNTHSTHFKYAKFLDEVANDLEMAECHYKHAIDSEPNYMKYRFNYARLLHKIGSIQKAFTEFNILINLEKSQRFANIWHHFHFSKLLQETQKYEETKKELEICIDLEKRNRKQNGEIYFAYGALLIDQFNDWNKGMPMIEKAIQICPNRKYYKDRLDEYMNEESKILLADAYAFAEHMVATGYSGVVSSNSSSFEGVVTGSASSFDDDDIKFEDIFDYLDETDEFGAVAIQDDDDNFSDVEENEKIATRCCQTEFDRFISQETLGYDFEKYLDKFEEHKINDIRWLRSLQMVNASYLRINILMESADISLWQKTVEAFNQESAKYISWLKENKLYTKYFEAFQRYGILTMAGFFYHTKSQDDVLYIIGLKNKSDAGFIWSLAQKEMANCFGTQKYNGGNKLY